MSSFDKVVKLACKPKPAPPKAKYLDPIVAATWSEDGAVHDVCKALVPRLREPNAIVVFKALIVLHTMIRNGATDNVLAHLSSSEVLRLRNVSAGNWEGYNAPQNMQHYALYLDSRIRAYRELKHDAIRVQAETNRDMRLNNSIEEDMAYTTVPPSKSSSTKSKAPQRSKTIMGRKLRVMTVEKGLLRETKTVQKMIDSLAECRFYLDDLEDELTITALRMLVKDLLILFQAGNEGVINVLEHYFEMSKYDAEEALAIYRNFCAQTERVVEYLGVARKLQNLLNVPIPNLKHAPVSLASSLQDYLNDPNFEQNRLEYKTSKAAADKKPKDRNVTPSKAPAGTVTTSVAAAGTSVKPPSLPPVNDSKPPNVNHNVSDFFSSIEEAQTPIFNPVVNSVTGNYLPQQTAHNPFVQRQMTGTFNGGQVQIQSTSFPPPLPFQPTQPFQPLPSFQAGDLPVQPQSTLQHRPFSTFIPQQVTGFPSSSSSTGFLQPQPTGANPFRQSILIPQATTIPTFGSNGVAPMPISSVPRTDTVAEMTGNLQLQPSAQPTFPAMQVGHNSTSEFPARPASTPLTGIATASSSPPKMRPVRSHQTGSRNPFGAPAVSVPPIPKPPTLFELSRPGMGVGQTLPLSQSTVATESATEPTLSTVASSFAFTNKVGENASSPSGNLGHLGSYPSVSSRMALTTGSNTTDSLFSSLPSQPTNSTISSHAPSVIKPQSTGFAGVKPFKPTSSFGASLLESLPPIPQSGPATPDTTIQLTAQHTSAPSLPTNLGPNALNVSSVSKDSNMFEAVGSLPMQVSPPLQRPSGGSAPGIGLRPQATGALGGANPFRATMFAATSAPSNVGTMPHTFVTSASTPSFGGLGKGTSALPVLGAGNTAFTSFTHLGQGSNMQQQNAGASLI